MLIASRSGFVADGRLPYERRAAWLESDGAQLVDTGVLCNQSTVVECGFYWTDTLYNMNVFGVYDNSLGTTLRFMIQVYLDRTPNAYWGKTTPTVYSRAVGGAWHDTSLGNNRWEVDGVTVQSWNDETFQSAVPLCLFARRYKNVNNPAVEYDSYFRGRISYARIKQGGSLVRDFIPVVSDGAGYMYDRVTGRLFGNQGTGSFAYGGGMP